MPWGKGHLFFEPINKRAIEFAFGLWSHTDPTRKHLLVVNVTLNPAHQVLDVVGRGHLCRSLEIFRVLPEILKPVRR